VLAKQVSVGQHVLEITWAKPLFPEPYSSTEIRDESCLQVAGSLKTEIFCKDFVMDFRSESICSLCSVAGQKPQHIHSHSCLRSIVKCDNRSPPDSRLLWLSKKGIKFRYGALLDGSISKDLPS